MASASSLVDENNFMCSICLDMYTQPVSLLCGHNFCKACITLHWDTKNPKVPNCPLCGEKFPIRPTLRVNIVIEDIVANYKRSVHRRNQMRSEAKGNGGVMCNMCAGETKPALKSCLVCFMSLCKIHLEPHQKIPNLKTHKLIEPTVNLEKRICKTHHEALEMFCRDDQAFVCKRCVWTTHKGHETVTIQGEAELKRTQLLNEKTMMNNWVKERQQKVQEIQESKEFSRINADKAMSESKSVIFELVNYMKRSHAELATVIKAEQMEIEMQANTFISELEKEIEQISKGSKDLDVTQSEDPFQDLERLIQNIIPQHHLKDWSGVKVRSETFEVKEQLASLTNALTREMCKLCDPDLERLKEFAVEVTFDPDTAHASLIVSDDGKRVFYSEKPQKVPNNPGRFTNFTNVFGKEGFSEGKFYYEVQVKNKTQWDIGVARGSIDQHGDIRLSPRNGFWTIWLRNGQITANAGPPVVVKCRNNVRNVGVFVDCDKGQVSFYNVDARVQIYSFYHCDFAENIFPFFSPCASDGGKNTAPLTIIPIQK
ncbi:unnamed protein product [Knipowitschia caucasica]